MHPAAITRDPSLPEGVFAFNPPKYVGYFEVLPGYRWAVVRRPALWHRLWLRALLGWRWHAEEPKS